MALTICLYEDKKYRNFFPLTYMRPVFALRAGMVPLFARTHRFFPDVTVSLACRQQLASILAATHKDYPVNIIKKGEMDVLLLNGRIRDFGDLPKLIAEARISTLFTSGGETVGILLKNEGIRKLGGVATPAEYQQHLQAEGGNIPEFHTSATLYGYLWEIMGGIEKEVAADFRWLQDTWPPSTGVKVHDGAGWVNQSDIFLGNGVEVMPGAVVDASAGPVYLGDNTRVESFAAVYGPTYVGPNSVVVAGKLTSSSIGHTCRIGGEVEHCVFQSYVNKYHAGFIGHSYVGEWVNFGAMTTNSDLKNNYSNIRVTVNGESIDTGSIKVGSFIGDHTKFGIGMLLNTGINIGVCCNIFGGSLVSDKEVPCFRWGSTGDYVDYDVNKAIEAASAVARRRDYSLSAAEVDLLAAIASGRIEDEGVSDFHIPGT
ncbi:MAG: hypothetical protein JSW34_03670 [Candidatus Zixiibacteriota bacterium]|nr:MAG: hypothetical protein JSW34_03670 [candidate division Zixibacteria bacterium]